MDKEAKVQRTQHPKDNANLFSSLTFFYTLDLFKRGFRNALRDDDLYQVLQSCDSKKLGDQLEKQWEIEKKRNKSPSIYRPLWVCFGKKYMVLGLLQLVFRTIMVLLVPEALGKLVSYFTPEQTAVTQGDAYLYASIVIGFTIINYIYTQNYMLAITELGIRIRTAVCSLIYRKCLKMTSESLSELSMGKVITLITKDVHAFEMVILYGNDIWIGIFQTCLICYLIYGKIGVAAFAGIGFLLTILPFQIIVGKLATVFRLKTSKKTDERLQITQETLSAIKIIKMYTWEKFFEKKISTSRRKEINAIQKLFYTKIVILILGNLSTKVAFYLLIMTHVWMGHNITAEIVYFVMSCFGKLRHLLSLLIPLGIGYIAELFATTIRLNSLLEADEIPRPRTNIEITTNNPKIIFKNAGILLNGSEIFKNIYVEFSKGVNVVVGYVGCGKTTFIKTILAEYQVSGELEVFGTISYASQEPWLFPSSIKNNILFGEEFVEKRYRKVLEICALTYDLASLSHGDETVVGDRGINLSKGQQARVNLARAVYKNSDIYLLDDCLSALDGHVADYIFKNCIKDFLRNKLCVFVTNNTDHIQEADATILIDNGTVKRSKVPEKIDVLKEDKESKKQIDFEEEVKLAEEAPKDHIYYESKKSGKVEFQVYRKFLSYGGGLIIFGLILGVFALTQGITSYSDKLVSDWVTLEQNLSSFREKNLTNSTQFDEITLQRSSILNLYTIAIATTSVLMMVRSVTFMAFIRRASINLHKSMITKMINATMQFFDSHFMGNVLNRFVKDLCTIDEHLPVTIHQCFELLLMLFGIIFLVSTVNPLFLVPFVVFFIIAYFVRFVYQRTGRSLQRLDASTRGPLIGHLNASLEGLTTIRAGKAQGIIIDEFDKHQDLYTSANYTLHCSSRALAFVLDGMSSLFIALVIARFLIIPNDTTVGNVGLAISQAFALSGLMQYGIRIWSEFENQMTSVERVLEYTEVKQEDKRGKTVDSWPKQGQIVFKNVSMTYDQNSKPVLNNINCTIKPNQKIGIVGRTGAGKSSIVSTLFRLYDTQGVIAIDDVDIQTLSLEFLRSSLSIIPQDPIIFSGTYRDNIDPLRKLPDEELWRIIKIAKLDNVVDNLTAKIGNLSAGQKQLICLARAMARNNKIVILDEATANMDYETDALIRDVIEKNFATSTVIVIAHRLVSVLSSDLVMVVNDGKIVEIDAPDNLIGNTASLFHEMVKRT